MITKRDIEKYDNAVIKQWNERKMESYSKYIINTSKSATQKTFFKSLLTPLSIDLKGALMKGECERKKEKKACRKQLLKSYYPRPLKNKREEYVTEIPRMQTRMSCSSDEVPLETQMSKNK